MSRIKSKTLKYFQDLSKDSHNILSFDYTKKFEKDIRRCESQGKDMQKIRRVVDMLLTGNRLPSQYVEHLLVNDKDGIWDCHLEPDWVLLYLIDSKSLKLLAVRTGTHLETGLQKESFDEFLVSIGLVKYVKEED